MKQLKASEIRQMFLDFFKEKNHQVEPSAPLVPIDDPTLLWINSGVATLKKYFDGSVVPQNPRLVNAQKAIRTNDIENVGYTARHHTFFEMLGNFSIGEYFKKEAIVWAWEFLTSDKWLGLDPKLLSVTVHPEDDEAYELWKNEVKVPEERIIRLEENFWDIGEGPSGPNTEIFYDRGEAFGNDPKDSELYPGGENERYLEVWNLVFSQFNHNPDDTYTPLPNKNIDTGLGLERIASIMQQTKTNFETDLFMPIIKQIETYTDVKYGETTESDTAFKVIADHIRTVAFAIGDHALPSNEGRGYVLRRLLRRAVRFAKHIHIEEPFMYKLVDIVGDIMADYYPEVAEQSDHISRIIKVEEERFHETLNDGLSILNDVIAREKKENRTVIPGEEAFKLYDTYGFPKELTEEYAQEQGFTVDEAGFNKEMEKQQNRARDARENVSSMNIQDDLMATLDVNSTFVGYNDLEVNTTVVYLMKDNEQVDQLNEGDEGVVLFAETPFYAESGGQVADIGYVVNTDCSLRVTDVQKSPKGQHLHHVDVQRGTIKVNDDVITMVEDTTRQSIIKNHTATHLLHQALRDEIGTHVTQAGSLVNSERLRFDFTHFESVTDEQLRAIEQQVNEKIWQALPVLIENKSLDDAKAMGAMALFGEKYDDIVRVVQIGDYSTELCGGCHVANSESIGIFKIVAESGIGAGTRRIEAVTGKEAYKYTNEQLLLLKESASLLKANVSNVPQRVQATLDEVKSLNRLNESLMDQLSHAEAAALAGQTVSIKGENALLKRVDVKNMNQLRQMVDELKQSIGSSVILLAAANEGKVMLSAGVTKDLVEKGVHAGKLIKKAAEICGGGGGGRPDMAQAGGKKPEKIEEALDASIAFIEEQLTTE